ncbi:hypothetical protein [Geodermatophilus sabuli]|uniref:Uncharacterized protein n=1 Tax=Geodermatophilus sabuli TaxID=1564158 RepID=A0A285E5H3_9ACTN|nr:hypothetical protein [Geodermatophilus sabuli]MBB3082915.1 hypothetical protein [Geodermatophilus sabuli]SNX94220.1 hypothetical protein SAMN06893097_1018 [Geodermatophilus sabuli]
MSDEMTIRLDSEEYVLRPDGAALQVGRRVGGDVTWLDTVDTGLLPERARGALERGDTGDAELLTALRGVVQAEVQRGG